MKTGIGLIIAAIMIILADGFVNSGYTLKWGIPFIVSLVVTMLIIILGWED